MIIKSIEIRDAGTCIPAIAIKTSPADEKELRMLWRTGYGTSFEEQRAHVLLCKMHASGERISYDPHDWGSNRSMAFAHQYLIENFDKLPNGALIDVQVLLGETTEPKESEFE